MRAQRADLVYLGSRYAVGMAFAHLLTAAEVGAVVISLAGQTPGGTGTLLREANLLTTAVLVGLGTVLAALIGAVDIIPSLRWFVAGRQPDARQRVEGPSSASRRESPHLRRIWGLSRLLGQER
jgi:hypothetical protein